MAPLSRLNVELRVGNCEEAERQIDAMPWIDVSFVQEYNVTTEAAIYSVPPSQAPSQDKEEDDEDDEDDDASWGSQSNARGKRFSLLPTRGITLYLKSMMCQCHCCSLPIGKVLTDVAFLNSSGEHSFRLQCSQDKLMRLLQMHLHFASLLNI